MKIEWVTNDFGHAYKGKTLHRGRTNYQKIEIFKTKTFGTLLFLDSKIQISEGDENRYHQYLVSAALLAHKRPQSALIIGGGDCFAIEEAIKFKELKRILMVELDKGVVDFCKKHYPSIRRCLKDHRVEIIYSDARSWMEHHEERFDVLIVDLTEPNGPSKLLYTREYYRLCRDRMKKGGILSVHADNHFLAPECFAVIYKTVRSVFPHLLTARVDMPCFGMGWTYRLASLQPLSLRLLERNLRRMERSGIRLPYFTPSLYRQQPTREELDAMKLGRISTDRHPFEKFERLGRVKAALP